MSVSRWYLLPLVRSMGLPTPVEGLGLDWLVESLAQVGLPVGGIGHICACATVPMAHDARIATATRNGLTLERDRSAITRDPSQLAANAKKRCNFSIPY